MKVTGQQFEAVSHTNVTSVLLTVQACLPLLQRAKEAKVVNIGRGLGSNQYANAVGSTTLSYGLSKAALNYLTTVFRYAVPSVAFLTLCPGWVSTDMGTSWDRRLPRSTSPCRHCGTTASTSTR